MKGAEQPLMAGLFVNDTMLFTDSEMMLQRIIDEFDRFCKRRKLKVNPGRLCINCAMPYRFKRESMTECSD